MLVRITLVMIAMTFSQYLNADSCDERFLPEKEMLELTYMTKDELIDRYCMAEKYRELSYSTYMKALEIRDLGMVNKYSKAEAACKQARDKAMSVLRKDHGMDSVDCS